MFYLNDCVHMYVNCQSLSIKMEIRVRTVKIRTAPGLFQYCSRTASVLLQDSLSVPGNSIRIQDQDQYTVQDACERYLRLRTCIIVTMLFTSTLRRGYIIIGVVRLFVCWLGNNAPFLRPS